MPPRLVNAPNFRLNLACGDSLLHGSARAVQGSLGFDVFAHHYQPEDAEELDRLLRPGGYHAVVANPPYITPKDRGLNEKYRERYLACYRQYSLAVPFMQRIFDLACENGFTGQITANSFMKREFGKKLIEEFFPHVDLTHVIDTSLAHIADYGTPTVILFGRHRRPVAGTIRVVMGIKREDEEPADPATGKVWCSILDQIDRPGSQSAYISVADSLRDTFHKHPWSIGGGGAAELKAQLDEVAEITLSEIGADIGVGAVTRENEVFLVSSAVTRRGGIPRSERKDQITGDQVRDWGFTDRIGSIWPYHSDTLESQASFQAQRFLWPWKAQLSQRVAFGLSQIQRGLKWFEYSMFFVERYRLNLSIAFPLVATHNHFVLDAGNVVFNHSAPIIKLPSGSQDDHMSILGLLNSSTAGCWMRQVLHDKGGGGVGGGIAAESWERFREYSATAIGRFPIPPGRQADLARLLDTLARQLAEQQPAQVLARSTGVPPVSALTGGTPVLRIRGQMIRLQEDLDWQCYRLYGLTNDLVDPHWQSRELPVKLGERAFEIVLARKVRDDGLHTTWFERHGSTPLTDLPAHWPADYRELVERRIAAIESNPRIALIEQPEYKRRWSDTPWEEKVTDALHEWLLDRLESYFDLDGRMSWGQVSNLPSSEDKLKTCPHKTCQVEVSLASTAKLADIAGRDPAFHPVAELYRGRPDFDAVKLVTELVEAESVPLLPVLRYKPSGLDKRRAWERTWELQRQEDAIDRRATKKSGGINDGGWTAATDDGESPLNPAQAELLKKEKVGSIPPPPKYKSADPPTSRRAITGGSAAAWTCRRNAGSASRTARGPTACR